MKIAVSSSGEDLDSTVDQRFGRCQYFLLIDYETMEFEAIPNPGMSASGGAGITAAQAVIDKGTGAVLTGHVGPNAFNVLSGGGLQIITGVAGTVREAVEQFKAGTFSQTTSPTVESHAGIAEPEGEAEATQSTSETKKVCIPTNGSGGLDDFVSPHFGRAASYTIVEPESMECETIPNTSEHMGGIGKPPELIAKTGAHVLICSNLGPRAIEMFQDSGIEVFSGAEGTVRDVIEGWKAGKLTHASKENACEEHKHEWHT